MTLETHSGPVPDANQVAKDIRTAMEATAKALTDAATTPAEPPGALYPLQYLGMSGSQPVFQYVAGGQPEANLMPLPDGGLALRNLHSGSQRALVLPYTLLPCSTVKQRSTARVLGVVVVVASMVLSAYPKCSSLFLHALRGGLEGDCEVGFVRTVLRGLRFECYCDGNLDVTRKSTSFMWRKQRPGGVQPLTVSLTVHHDQDNINVDGICGGIHLSSSNATVPNLHRVAAVSAPAADTRLFVALAKAVERMKQSIDDPRACAFRLGPA